MTVGVRNFQGSRLREARLARGLFKNALGQLIGVSGTAVARYEEGEDRPAPDRLEVIARQLNFAPEFFLQAAWPEEIELIHWRSQASESKAAREMTEQRMRWLCEIYAYLSSEVDFSSTPIPDFSLPADISLITSEQIERIATELRHEWGLRSEPIPDMILALENAGIPVTALDFSSERQDGCCFHSKLLNKTFVAINIESASAVRVRLDAAHELGHVILHKNVAPAQARHPVFHKLMEKQAFRFAGALLFPREAFFDEVPDVSLDYLCALKRRWGMAISAMIVRAADLGVVDTEEVSSLFRAMTRRRWRGVRMEPFDNVMAHEKPRMLRRGFETLLGSGMFAKSAIRSALPQPSHEIEQIAGLSPGTLGEDRSAEFAVSLRERTREVIDLESGNVLHFPMRPRTG
jgi:Zn-dependent peptidase ImmA (M78 family)